MKKGLHDDDVSSKYQAQGCITRAVQEFLIFFPPASRIFKPKIILKIYIINAFRYVNMFASNLVLRYLKDLNFQLSPARFYFLVKILKPVWEEKFIRDSNPLSVKNDVTILKPARWQENNANYRKVLFNNTLQPNWVE